MVKEFATLGNATALNIENQFLQKGKIAQIGETRTHSDGSKWKKVAEGKWEPVHENHEKKDQPAPQQNSGQAKPEGGSGEKPAEQPKPASAGSAPQGHPFANKRASMDGNQFKSEVDKLFKEYPVTRSGFRIRGLFQMGCSQNEIASLTGYDLTQILNQCRYFCRESGIDYDFKKERSQNNIQQVQQNQQQSYDAGLTDQLLDEEAPLVDVTVQDKWQAYKNYATMICHGMGKSVLVYGSGGVGKTFTLTGEGQVFEQQKMRKFDEEIHNVTSQQIQDRANENLEEGEEEISMAPSAGMLDKEAYDYISYTGKMSANQLYRTLFEHNGKIVVLDDIDSILNDEDAVNILKGALDTSGDGTINWGTATSVETQYTNVGAMQKVIGNGDNATIKYLCPKRFKFKGQVIFITNKTRDFLSKKAQPLLSRGFALDLTMSVDETVNMIGSLRHQVKIRDRNGDEIQISKENRDAAFDFLSKYKNRLSVDDLNIRTFNKIALTAQALEGSGQDWKKTAATTLGITRTVQ